MSIIREIIQKGTVDSNNSTETTLPADTGGTDHIFTGEPTNILEFAGLCILIHSDVASKIGGLEVQYSANCINWHRGEVYTILAGAIKFFTPPIQAKWFRIVYTNGVVEQTMFHLHTTLKRVPIKWSGHNINEAIQDEDDAELVKAVLTAKVNGGGFDNIGATTSGNLRVTDAENGLAIAKGDVVDTTFIHKFGQAPDFDVLDGFVTVWDGARDDEGYESMEYIYSTSADIDTLSSDDGGNTQDIEVQGLDVNYDVVVQTKTLNGLNKVVLDTPLIRVFRLKNVNSTDISGHVFVSVDGTLTDGTPTSTNVRAVISGDNNQTLMAVYTIPAGKTGYMREWYASTAGAKKDSSHTIKVLARPFEQVFQLKHIANIGVTGTSYIKHTYIEPEVLTEKTDIEIRMNTDQDVSGVASGFDIVLVDN